jgi:hypothetical protein
MVESGFAVLVERHHLPQQVNDGHVIIPLAFDASDFDGNRIAIGDGRMHDQDARGVPILKHLRSIGPGVEIVSHVDIVPVF